MPRPKRWNILNHRGRSLLVVCPRCGELGRLYYSPSRGWFVKHGPYKTHSLKWGEPIEVPLHDPKLGLGQYMGGDGRILHFIAKMLNPHNVYVEVFGGLAPLLLNKPPSPLEVYNDVDGDLVNLFLVVKDKPRAFLEKASMLLHSREMYYTFLHRLRSGEWQDDVDRAVMFFYILRYSFSGKLGRGFSTSKVPSSNPAKKYWSTLSKIKLVHKRLREVTVEKLDFRELIKKYDSPQTLFYLDPPHRFYGIEKGRDYYRSTFTEEDYEDLLIMLEKVKGKWLLKQNEELYTKKWAEEHGYTYKCLRMISSAPMRRGKTRSESMKICFMANYNLR